MEYEPTYEIMKLCAKPQDWLSPSDKPEDFERWGPTFSTHRDADILTVSNWETIKEDMLERFPDDTWIASSRHWAVGWMDELYVRHYDDNGPTQAHEAIMEWKGELESYPVADEEDFRAREYEAELEYLTEWYSLDEDQALKVRQYLNDGGDYFVHESSGVYMDEEPIEAAKKALGFDDDEDHDRDEQSSSMIEESPDSSLP